MRKFITLTTCIAIFYNIFTPIRLLYCLIGVFGMLCYIYLWCVYCRLLV